MPENIIKKDSLSQWKQDMILYSIETNRKRAVPDAKDGLKRVQRRILDSMYNQLPCATKLVKTAEVVGNVIGRSHPHGNCLSVDTNVYLLSGSISTIGELYNSGVTTFESLGVNSQTLKIEPILVHDLRIGTYTEKICHIQLSNGTEIKCTLNHPIMIYNGDYMEAEYIKPGILLHTNLQTYSTCNNGTDRRPYIRGNGLVQDIVYEYVKHHKDENVDNNSITNLRLLTIGNELYNEYISNHTDLMITTNGTNDSSIHEQNKNAMMKISVFKNIQKLIINTGLLDINYYSYIKYYPHWKEKLTKDQLNLYIDEYLRTNPIVINTWVEDTTSIPMFDFTVDTTNNMVIPMIGNGNLQFNEIPFICVHNSSVEDAIKPMSNWFESKMPLIYSESNMGSMQGDGAAASRYTEIMLSEFSKDCVIADMKESKDIVDWSITYNNRAKEPDYFPVAVPLLLINGSFGIGTGLMTEIPKHNLVEVIDATLNLIKNPDAPVILIPDHCMECEIIDTNWKSICNKGKGKYIVRSKIDIEYEKDEPLLIIRSIPDRVFFDKGNSQNGGVKYTILDMVRDGKLPQIKSIEEHSHGNNMKIVIRLKKGSDPNYTRDLLYKTTLLQNTYTINFEILDGYKPLRLSYKSYLQFFIEQRKITKFRLYSAQLQKYSTRYHERETYVKVLESGEIDNIINMIKNRTSSDDTELIEYLVKKIHITDLQAKFIINSNLKSLSKAYLNRYKEDIKICAEKIQYCENKILNEELIIQDIIEELEYYKKKYGQPRKCKVISKNDITAIPKGNFKIVITENNYIKKLQPNENIVSYKGDNPKHVINVENTENLLLFSTQGKVFKLPVHQIPVTVKNSVGCDIRILLKGLTSDIISVIYEPNLKLASKKFGKDYLVVVTANNCIKKLELGDFLTVPPSGIIYTKLNSGDYVKEVAVIPDMFDIILYSDRRALRVPMSEIPNYKRSTLGVSAMNLKDGEIIDGLSVILTETTDIVVITQSGRINKFSVAGLPISSRYKSGNSVIKLGKNDKIHSIFGVNDNNDTLKLITTKTNIDLPVKDIPRGSSISSGSKIIPASDLLLKTIVVR